MKKLFCVLLALGLLLGLCVPAFADAGAPMFLEYDAMVSNSAGAADQYDSTRVIPYGSIVTVQGEYDQDGYMFAFVNYNNNYYSVKLSDLTKLEDEVPASKGIALPYERTYVVINGSGLAIRKGPAESYDGTGSYIPSGEEFTSAVGTETGRPAWVYTEFGGVSGWVNVDTSVSGYRAARKLDGYVPYTGTATVFGSGVRLWKVPDYYDSGNSAVTGDIPAGTELNFKYYYSQIRYTYALTEYNGTEGWLMIDADEDPGVLLGEVMEVCVNVPSGAKITTGPYGTGTDTGVTLPQNEIVTADGFAKKPVDSSTGADLPQGASIWDYSYTYVYTFHVNYNGTEGWVTTDYKGNYDDFLYNPGTTLYATTAELKMYADHNFSSGTVGTIPAGSDFTGTLQYYDPVSYQGFVYATYNGQTGWIANNWSDVSMKGEAQVFEYTDPDAPLPVTEDGTETGQGETGGSGDSGRRSSSSGTPPKTDGGETQQKNPMTAIIIGCVVGTVVIAAAAAATVTYLNKKKKQGSGQ